MFRRLTAALLLGLLCACSEAPRPDPYEPQPAVRIQHPAWARSAAIYEMNTRQMTPEGTLRAAEAHLPRIKALGVGIVWLMPIHPIGEQHRKGPMGSPYSIRDYFAVNPELGTLDDLRHFVDEAHRLGLYVILDWVANHTAWDHPMRLAHPEWYDRDYKGDFRSTPWFDWSDIVDLDYHQRALREYMTRAMTFWVREAGIDGYRCDAAGLVPLDFWNQVRRELDAIKPVFMLAEWEARDLHAEAFDASYAWSWREHLHRIAQGKADVGALFHYYSWNEGAYPRDVYRMTYISNHDSNAWEGTQFEAFGEALEAAIVLSVVGEGMPLLYSGQEAGNPRRLAFFERDPIEWRAHPVGELYRRLFALKKSNTALWNGAEGATMIQVPNDAPQQVFSFVRQNGADKVFVVLNLSDRPQRVRFREALYHGRYREFFGEAEVVLDADFELSLPPWQYQVYVR